ncbi:MAG: 16S rRNA (guanine(966)-N(2))-methyltransferase RsmD [Nitrospinaceae bacterium]|nr:MAG: 16S rRNA (guanine(966)-N(2))-methyltransferase RsmD [Nitrospinaceae bacterium]
MRVISGTARGTRLTSLKGAPVRPTLDRMKESFFNRVGPGLAGVWFLDLFAGSGGIGIEALSRGAEKVVFVENDPRAQLVIYQNLAKCHMGPEGPAAEGKRWVLLKMDALHAIDVLAGRGLRFDVVYVDPPFALGVYDDVLLGLAESPLLGEGCRVVVEHHHKQVLAENYATLALIDSRRMGDNRQTYFGLG